MKPTDAELEILHVLWANGPSTVRQVHDNLSQNRDIGYTTALKLMQIMYEKGLLSREEDGRSHTYTAVVTEEDTQRNLVDRFVETAFRGSASKLVMQVLGQHKASREELDEIKTLLNNLNRDLLD
ncbi:MULTISPECIES: BlaI/MecI/CopY family transcriptional regulator [unclassified Spirosoma]|uniref:BlaI/MecI/CopY family transcriptional regulator n=1 Tax=unclassified Spirosoma TaxID=2621999 RepID=UPI000966C06D|nr:MULTISPECIES: BlaI/MecI/CopY family transcriptional regulator [unclassified Spirosoma]MBN8825922.1 BlaI/MecI/CopY family transcriptional regulator [Spirosoma sp.]OJW70606.1 MAG: transcriptional regulator [Spirosoma sp. 48-14]